jgi:hypothetical protein
MVALICPQKNLPLSKPPRSPTGKMQRREIMKLLAAEEAKQVLILVKARVDLMGTVI